MSGTSERCTTTRTTRGEPISAEPRINERIRVPEVRLVGPNGEQVGIVRIEDALRLAAEADLDLVEVAPMAKPPVCKLMDYGKFKYESALKAREDRKKQVNTVIKEMKLRPKIDAHDYETKKGHVVRFLKAGDKVKITIMFRGREQSRPELGFRLLKKLADDVVDYGFVEYSPEAGRPQHDHGARPDEEEGRRHGGGPGREGRREGARPRGDGADEAPTTRSRPSRRHRRSRPSRSSPRPRPSPRRRSRPWSSRDRGPGRTTRTTRVTRPATDDTHDRRTRRTATCRSRRPTAAPRSASR